MTQNLVLPESLVSDAQVASKLRPRPARPPPVGSCHLLMSRVSFPSYCSETLGPLGTLSVGSY